MVCFIFVLLAHLLLLARANEADMSESHVPDPVRRLRGGVQGVAAAAATTADGGEDARLAAAEEAAHETGGDDGAYIDDDLNDDDNLFPDEASVSVDSGGDIKGGTAKKNGDDEPKEAADDVDNLDAVDHAEPEEAADDVDNLDAVDQAAALKMQLESNLQLQLALSDEVKGLGDTKFIEDCAEAVAAETGYNEVAQLLAEAWTEMRKVVMPFYANHINKRLNDLRREQHGLQDSLTVAKAGNPISKTLAKWF